MSTYTREVRLRGLGRSHELVLELVPRGATVLDVGCASGYLAEELLARGASAVDGIELDPDEAEAAGTVCRTVVQGSIESSEVLTQVADGEYDAIVLADVIEHLRSPEDVLRGLLPKLHPRGCIVVSVPNIAHWSVRLSLLRGRFRYEETGLLDRTHLRFFTRDTLRELIQSVGLVVEREEIAFQGVTDPDAVAAMPVAGPSLAEPYSAVARRLAGLLGYQFVVAARRPRDGAQGRID